MTHQEACIRVANEYWDKANRLIRIADEANDNGERRKCALELAKESLEVSIALLEGDQP